MQWTTEILQVDDRQINSLASDLALYFFLFVIKCYVIIITSVSSTHKELIHPPIIIGFTAIFWQFT